MTPTKEYFAFISYQRGDEKWADWLCRKLEHYRLPVHLRKENPSLPREIRPIFRDKLELAGGVLADEIRSALDGSRFLIVICSPRSAQSIWVNKEVQTFIEMGRARQIIPFIIEGTPFSEDDGTECFTPAVRDLRGQDEILGININEMGRDAAAVKVVATMFGLKFDTLWQRYQREQRKRRRLIIGGALLFALLSLGIGLYIARQNAALEAANREITSERDRANLERDRAERANEDLSVANDSILRQHTLIEESNLELQDRNRRLAIERDRVLKANWSILASQSRFVAEKARQLTEEGNYVIARRLAAAVLPADIDAPTDRPYVSNAEYALWKSWLSDGAILQGQTERITAVALSRDGRIIASGEEFGGVRLWNAETGIQLNHPIKAHKNSIAAISFSPDGSRFATVSNDGIIKIWNTETGEEAAPPIEEKGVRSIAFSPDGKYIASGSKRISLWDLATGKRLDSEMKGHSGSIAFLMFSPDGDRIISSDSRTVGVWDVKTGELLFPMFDGTAPALSSNGKVLVTGDKKSLVFWDALTGKKMLTTKPLHEIGVRSIVIAPDGKRMITMGYNQTALLWDLNEFSYKKLSTSGGSFEAFFPDSKRVLSVIDKDIFIRSLDGLEKLKEYMMNYQTIEGNDSDNPVNSIAVSPDGRHIASGGDDGRIRIWDVGTRKLVMSILLDTSSVTATSVVDTSETFITDDVWASDLNPGNMVYSVAYSPDGKIIAAGSSDRAVRLWDARTGKLLRPPFEGHTSFVKSVAFSPDGSRIVSCGNESIRIWDVRTGRTVRVFEEPKSCFASVSFFPDGKKIVTAGSIVQVWDIESGRRTDMRTYDDASETVYSVAVSPDGSLIASGHNSVFLLWDARTGRQLPFSYKGQSQEISSIAFSPDGTKVAAASRDGCIRIWGVDSGELIMPELLTVFFDAEDYAEDYQPELDDYEFDLPECIAFSPDGESLIAGYFYGNIRIWDISLKNLLQKTRATYPPLTEDERKLYYLE